MSGYRPIYKRIWKDPDYQELIPNDKLLFLYLCTNEATTESGIYPLTPKTAADETGIDIETVRQRFTNGFYKNVVYDNTDKFIFVRKLKKYGTGGRPDLIETAIRNEFISHPNTLLWDEFIKEYPEYEELLNGCKTVSKLSDTIRYSIDNNIENILSTSKSLKKYPVEHVGMRKDVFAGLKQRRGYNLTAGKVAGEAKAISWMFGQGYSPDDILKAYDILKEVKFWQNKPLTMMSLQNQIGEVIKQKDGRQTIKPQGVKIER